MTIGLTYSNDLSRVQVALSDLPDGTVRIERSTNQLLWETVRGGTALPVSSGSSSLDNFEFAADIENFYRVLPVDPEPGLILPGASGDYASTPDHATLDITGNIRISAEATLDDWASIDQTFVAKFEDPGERAYFFRIRDNGQLRMTVSTDGTNGLTFDSGTAVPASDGERMAVRVQVSFGATSTANFYTAPSIDGPWTFLGTEDRNDTSGGINTSTAALEIGSWDGGTQHRLVGTVHAVVLEDGIGGTVVADPDFAAQAGGATSFDDDAGRTWTINGNAEIVGVEIDSITPSLSGQIWLKSIRHPFLNRPVTTTGHGDPARPSRGAEFDVTGRSVPIAVTDVRGSRAFTLEFMTETLTQARDMDLILASGDVFLIHVPPDCPVPGGYVTIGDTSESRRSVRGARRYFALPCRVVAQPVPEIVGATLNWKTVRRLYGDSWQNVRASNPTWGDLLDTIADAEDLVVL